MPDGSKPHAPPSAAQPSAAEERAAAVLSLTLTAERAVLAAALLSPTEAAPLLPSLLTPRDFVDPRHACIFESIVRVLGAGTDLDVLTLTADLRARDRINTVGGAQYVGELTDEIPTVAHLESHVRIVRDAADTRRIANDARVLLTLCLGGAAMGEIEAKVAELASAGGRAEERDLITLGAAGELVIEHLERVASGQHRVGITTGFRGLDRLLGRLRPGQLIVVGARPAMGKSAFTEIMAIAAALEELVAATKEKRLPRPVLFFSLEMPALEIAMRAMAYLKQVDLARIVHGRLTQDELTRVFDAMRDLARMPFKIHAGPVSFRRIRSLCLHEKARTGGVLAVYVDYVQLVLGEGRAENRERELSEITRGMKLLAGERELGCPVVLDAQLNRKLEERKDKRPIEADLRESGSLEQDGDVLLFVYRDEVYNPETEHRGRAEILVRKQRNGPPGMEVVGFHGATTTFYDLDPGRGRGDAPATEEDYATYASGGEGLPMDDPAGVFVGETPALALEPGEPVTLDDAEDVPW